MEFLGSSLIGLISLLDSPFYDACRGLVQARIY
jgi:hypothetical protein